MKNLISIIIPVYNTKKEYVEECIDSVIGIDLCNIIVVDDGSSIDTSYIKEKYKDYKNFYFYKKENGGLSSARNFGINKANSKYIMFLDSDDFIDTEKLGKALNFIKTTTKTAYYFGYINVFKDNRIKESNKFIKECDYITIDENFINNQLEVVAVRYIINRQFILDNKLYFYEGVFHEDEEWTPKFLTTIDKVYSLKSYIYFYRMNVEGSITNSYSSKHFFDILKIIKLLNSNKKIQKEEIKKRYINSRISKLIYGLFLKYHYLNKEEKQKYKVEFNKIKNDYEYIELDKNNKITNYVMKYADFNIIVFYFKIVLLKNKFLKKFRRNKIE